MGQMNEWMNESVIVTLVDIFYDANGFNTQIDKNNNKSCCWTAWIA